MGIEERHFSARLDCRYILQTPADADSSFVVIALHGYGMDPETMLRLAATWFPCNSIASIQAPHPFFAEEINKNANLSDERKVGFSWATSANPVGCVRLHHEIVRHVLADIGVPPERRLLLGFSQPVSLNYRFVATYPDQVRGVLGVCGGLPNNWETGHFHAVHAAVYHIARADDEVYSPLLTREYEARLRKRAQDVSFMELPGPHRFPSLAQPSVAAWARRVFSR